MDTPIISVVTGASRGLGRAAALRLATMDGHRVIATARQVADLASLSAKLEMGGHRIETHQLDVTDDRSVAALREWIAQRYGYVDVLINNAGILLDRYTTRVAEVPLETVRATLETNLFGSLRVTQALLPLLHASRAGRVVNLSSEMGQLAEMEAGSPAYRISKTAINAFTRILAVELSDTPIKVNAACPGWCRTDLGGHNATRSPEEGIDTVIWLATLPPDGPTGGFFRDRQPIAW
jgi:NAD(P)-dependent dehydrogenase (short-subunit alcohol dehydrogenase family)